ncbi:MAG TPA: DinB family protein [Anaerolineae bacterium]|nr:DinB family protein [Anaerolineae bacterium]
MMNPEIAEYLKALRELREKVLKTLDGVDAEGLNWKPTGDETNSLYVIATHAIGSEHGWIFEILGGGEKTRNRPAEFQARGNDSIGLRDQYARVAKESESILANLTADDLLITRNRPDRGDVSERWIILHVIRHYSEHLGQMYLTRQLWEDSQRVR